ncbi:hypothetical protein LQZ19_03645 [Treponema primitia]|uniref:hypothetical protein n=1 Tax=Treponema primitia TaxID=88058 RepID=UPI003980BF5C
MKSPVIILGVVITAGLCMGCAGLRYQKEINLSSNLPLGVITVLSNYNIYWDDEDPGSSNHPKKNENPEKTKVSRADVLITDAEAILMQSFDDVGVTTIVPKEQITGSQAYAKAKRHSRWNKKGFTIANGYDPINFRDKNFALALAKETGVKAGVYVIFDFSKSMSSGIGKTGYFQAQVYMQVIVVDETGRILYKKNRVVTSDNRIRVFHRTFNEQELLDLFRSTIANACYLFIQEFVVANSQNLEN